MATSSPMTLFYTMKKVAPFGLLTTGTSNSSFDLHPLPEPQEWALPFPFDWEGTFLFFPFAKYNGKDRSNCRIRDFFHPRFSSLQQVVEFGQSRLLIIQVISQYELIITLSQRVKDHINGQLLVKRPIESSQMLHVSPYPLT